MYVIVLPSNTVYGAGQTEMRSVLCLIGEGNIRKRVGRTHLHVQHALGVRCAVNGLREGKALVVNGSGR